MFKKILLLFAAIIAMAATARAQEKVAITFHTTLYDLHAETNVFTFYLGASQNTYFDVDCGYGTFEVEVEEAVFDASSSGINGTPVTCTVSKEGNVTIYGDASVLDYIDMEGCYITSIDLSQAVNVKVLNLKHNQLEALDLTPLTRLEALYLTDNMNFKSPLVLGKDKPALTILEISIINDLDKNFNLSDYPAMASFEAWSVHSLENLDPTGCPELLRLSADATNISSIDVSKNPNLLILNVSETKVTSLDVTHNPYLTELYAQHMGSMNHEYKIDAIDITKNPYLVRLYLDGNNLTALDLSGNPALQSFSVKKNHLKGIDFSNNPKLYSVDISQNDMDFVTIPAARDTFGEYYYSQNPFAAARSYAVGTVLDFSSKVIRPDSETDAVLFNLKETDPMNPVILDSEYFTWDPTGKMTLNAAVGASGDSVYVAFINSALPDAMLTTAPFVVKEASQVGQPVEVVNLNYYPTVKNVQLAIGVSGATPENPVTFQVDFGAGPQEFTATAAWATEVNVTGTRTGRVRVLVPEDRDITSFDIRGQRLLACNVADARSLQHLVIKDCQLPTLDLTWNRCLATIDLSGNNLSFLDLAGPNGNYGKNMLHSLNVADNRLTRLVMPDAVSVRDIVLDNNLLTAIPAMSIGGVNSLSADNNRITEASLLDAENLDYLSLSGNEIRELDIPEYVPLNQGLHIDRNYLTLNDLPLPGISPDYNYAPQKEISLPDKAPSANLSANHRVVDGQETRYAWFKAQDGTPLPEAAVTNRGNGRFRFNDYNVGQVYCSMTHPAFPQFETEGAITTTPMLVVDKPDKYFASFVTAQDANAVLTLTGVRNGTTVYVDWTGEDDFEQYILKDTYIQFPVEVKGGKEVKCYTYEESDGITVFSLRGAPLESMDVSGLKDVQCLIVTGAHLGTTDKIKFPTAATLTELSLEGNDLESFNPAGFESLQSLTLSVNNIESLDVSSLKDLRTLYLAGAGIKDITLDNPRMWELSMVNNNLTALNLSGVPAMEQLWLSYNELSALDVTGLSKLRVLTIDNNKFTFNTLPAESPAYYVYTYTNQAPVEAVHDSGVVDLSQHAVSPHGPATTYTWYIDSPYVDEYGTLTGEELYVDEEYLLENGVTTFLKPFNHIMCVMHNAAHPALHQFTNFLDVTAGVDDIAVDNTDATAPVEYYNLSGMRMGANRPLAPGIYIRRQGNTAVKVRIK